MIIKLDTQVFKFTRQKSHSESQLGTPLTRAQWINADRIVMAAMFIATIAGSLLF